MVLLTSRHRICIVDILYTKHFVWNALPEERAAGSRQSVGAAWRLEHSSRWVSLPTPGLCSD
eukprot:6018138-Prymnesium_polylepis.1